VPDFSILIPHHHTAVDRRALRVALDTIIRHTVHDYELIIQAQCGGNAYPPWNAMARAATSDWLLFTVTDQFVTPGWDEPLWDARGPDVLVVGGLVESGFRAVAAQNLEGNFGLSPETYDEAAFNTYAATKPALPTVEAWVTPWLINRQAFLDIGGFDVHPTISDLRFFQRWLGAGKTWKRVPSYSYHLMNWNATGADR
jgi:hypothetical protein